MLWTGGFDSTFRVADLVLTHGRRVRPWYVVDPERRTSGRELGRMASLRQMIVAIDASAGRLLEPLEVRPLGAVVVDAVTTAAARAVGARIPMGAQYSWLAALARSVDCPLEFSIEGPVEEFALFADARFVRAAKTAPDDWSVLVNDGNDPDLWRLFGAFHFPIIHLTKPAMSELARERGFDEVLGQTWFCRWPTVLGNPCGQCTPCRVTRTAGMERRVPPDTRLRRRLHRLHWDLVRHRESGLIRAAAIAERIVDGRKSTAARASRQ